jgi:hypothetical protein
MGNSFRVIDLEVERLISRELISYLKGSRPVLENVLKHYGAKERKGNWDCISARHSDARHDLSISYKNSYVCACHCGLSGDVFKVVGILEGVTDFNEQVKKVCDINNINMIEPIDNRLEKVCKKVKAVDKKEYDFNAIVEELHKNIGKTDYFTKRGLATTIDKYRLGYHPDGLNFIINNYEGILEERPNDLYATYQYFIPCYNEHGICNYILARRNDSLKIPQWVKFKVNKTHNLKGYAATLLNIRYLYKPQLTEKFIFIVESWADALSLEELGYNAISLNSVSNINIFLKHIKKNKDLIKNKVFIAAGNADTAGSNMNINIVNELKKLNIQCHIYSIPRHNDFNEFFMNNRTELKVSIEEFILHLEVNGEKNIEEKCNPIPFDDYDTLQGFPIGSLISWQRKYVEAVAETTQTPVDLAAVLTLAALSTAIQGKFIVEGYEDWIEPLNLYIVAIMKPSERKSPVFKHIFKPIFDYENLENEKLKPEIEKRKAEKKILEEQKTYQERIASNPKGKDHIKAKEIVMRLSEEIANFKELTPIHLISDDITPERCATLLAENNGRLSILSSEASVFEIMKGRYANNGSNNFEVFLKGYSGDEIRVDRQKQTPIYVNNPNLTIGLAVQPDVIEGLMQSPALRGRGLTARFLYSVPKSLVGKRKINAQAIPKSIKREYCNSLNELLKIETPEQPYIIKLSKEAKVEFDKFREELEPRLIDDLSFICEWAGKLAGNILRIAALLFLANGINNNVSSRDLVSEIPHSIMVNAIAIGRYFIEHARGAFGMMGNDTNTENAKVLLKWTEEIKQFKRYDAYRILRYRCRKVEEIDPALQILIDRNYLILHELPYSGTGRKPDAIYRRIN